MLAASAIPARKLRRLPTTSRSAIASEIVRSLSNAVFEFVRLIELMLLHDARREARYDAEGDLVLLEDQDRTLWNQAQIREGLSLAGSANDRTSGPFAIQAAIATVHCRAARPADTDWREIFRNYDLLETVQPSPIVSLNRAVAVAMTEGAGRRSAFLMTWRAGENW